VGRISDGKHVGKDVKLNATQVVAYRICEEVGCMQQKETKARVYEVCLITFLQFQYSINHPFLCLVIQSHTVRRSIQHWQGGRVHMHLRCIGLHSFDFGPVLTIPLLISDTVAHHKT